jgi:hypothetical protein
MTEGMLVPSRRDVLVAALLSFLVPAAPAEVFAQAADPLPSWNEGQTKRSVLTFVERTTREGGADAVPVEERIAVFDNDGTLWSEQPVYFQIMFALGCCRSSPRPMPA